MVLLILPNLLVVIDGVLQTPSIDYSFNGGTQITFSEAPKSDYSCQIFFYKGSQNDTSFIDVDPPLEIGDKLELSIPIEDSLIERQEARTIVGINSSNSVRTTTYCENGLSQTLRPAHIIRQNSDVFIGGELVSKKRLSLEVPLIRPESTLIRSLNNVDTEVFVDSISKNFNIDSRATNDIIIASQDPISVGNSVSKSEIISDVSVSGGHGTIVGVGTSAVGINTTSPMLGFTIQSGESINAGPLGITTDIYFIISNSNVGNGVTSIEVGTEVSTVGIGTSFIDNIYRS